MDMEKIKAGLMDLLDSPLTDKQRTWVLSYLEDLPDLIEEQRIENLYVERFLPLLRFAPEGDGRLRDAFKMGYRLAKSE